MWTATKEYFKNTFLTQFVVKNSMDSLVYALFVPDIERWSLSNINLQTVLLLGFILWWFSSFI